jgi:multiple sugar transport system ATP-binding protein
MAEIRIENLHKAFGDFVAVRDSTLTVGDGEFFVLLGPSGCGKTTTLRMIAGLELPTAGRILLGGEDVTFDRARERDIAFVFQLFALYPHMSVRRNVGFPLKCQGMSTREIARRVEEAARLLRIDGLLDRSVGGLSGGDRQRVALGRAIVREPKAFLMDEPLGALDSEFRALMCGELRSLHNRLGATTVYVTHDQLEAMAMADKIAVMNRGIVEQFGTPREIYERPASMFVADFVGSPPMTLLRFCGRVARGDRTMRMDGTDIPIPAFDEDGIEGDLAIGIRPEYVRLDDAGPIAGTVFGAEYLGTNQIVAIDTPFGQVKARIAADITIHPGEAVRMSFPPARLSLFDAASGRALRTMSEARVAEGRAPRG